MPWIITDKFKNFDIPLGQKKDKIADYKIKSIFITLSFGHNDLYDFVLFTR